MIISEAKTEDCKQIAELISKFRVALKELKGIKSKPNIENAISEFKEYAENEMPIYYARDNDKYLGYMVLKINSGVVWLESIFVDKQYRNKGIGKLLFSKAEEIAKSLGEDTIYNWVHPNNITMINFLKDNGYNTINLIEIRKDDGKDNTSINVGSNTFKY